MEQHLIIFIRNPVKGKVKSRIAATTGHDKAYLIYHSLLQILHRLLVNYNSVKHLYYSDNIEQDDMWDDHTFIKQVQSGGDLGKRMSNAFYSVFDRLNSKMGKVIIIGSDCPGITPKILDDAWLALDTKDVVIGPANDGGYYLLGMKEWHSNLFENVEWGTNTVFTQTMQHASNNNLSCALLSALSDIDTEEDWNTYCQNQAPF